VCVLAYMRVYVCACVFESSLPLASQLYTVANPFTALRWGIFTHRHTFTHKTYTHTHTHAHTQNTHTHTHTGQ